jgi:hypothetical protein
VSQNVIELNGKRYDAITGALLGKSIPSATSVMQHHITQARVIDGFIRPSAAKANVSHNPTTARPKSVSPKPVEMKPHTPQPKAPTASLHHAGHAHMHAPAKSVERHHPEHAKTLMRHTVRKPEMRLKPAIKPQAPAEVMAKPMSAIARKQSVAQVDPTRLERAKTIVRHAAVRRFRPNKTGTEPAVHYAHPTTGHIPVIAVRPQPATRSVTSPRHTDIFEDAIKRAKSHEQPAYKPRRAHHRMTNTLAVAATFIILGSFVAYLNLPNIQLHIASVEAGFQASLPGYRPTGYALRGGIQRNGGTVSMSFTSGDSSYTITEQSSNWDSQTLLDNTLALAGQHQTIERNGRTIYIYGNNASAAWVTGNIRYDITGNASLGSDQLANIAASM